MPPRPALGTSNRVGRDSLRKMKGRNKGFCPLEKWLPAVGPTTKDLGKVKYLRDNSKAGKPWV